MKPPSLFRAFIFNRTVIALLIGACFVVTALDLYLDSSQDKIVDFSALKIAESNATLLSQLNQNDITSFKSDRLTVEPFSLDSAKDEFQKKAAQSLSRDPTKPYYEIAQDHFTTFRYAANFSSGFYELDVPLDDLQTFAGTQSTETLWVLSLLAIASTASLVIFFGFLRWEGEVLVEAQQKALEYQKALTYAYGRFFPHQFLDLLDKKNILDIHLGDHADKQMVVVFADIRNFTSLIEKKTPAESFKIINDYLLQVSPIIRMNNGFIDKYIGDAIMALFESSDEALSAMVKIINLLKQDPSLLIKEIGVGIHVGPLMVGTVGEVERMDGTVISDVVNTASRLEPLNKAYGTHILVSEDILNQIPDRNKYKIRFIDHIYAKGKHEGLKIFEVYDMDPPEVVQKKDGIKESWDKGIECYRNRQFAESLEWFKKCQSIYPEDRSTAIYVQRTSDLIANPPDASWTPIAQLSQKDEVH